jgi:hypothetical protein
VQEHVFSFALHILLDNEATGCRGLKMFTKECRPVKLFAKHLKVEEQVCIFPEVENWCGLF